ncbi:MAG: MATE family efflux transporter [Dorea sp.]|nr:MATE family efflux transporter [Dorea sp.]
MELTKGPIVRTILGLAIPIMASSFLGTLYNICDMAWVGTLGAKTVAGVGVGGMYMWLASGLAVLPKMGGQVLTAQAIGAGQLEKARGYTRAAVQIVVLFGILWGAMTLLFTRQLVGFFTLNDPVAETVAINYLKITCGLILFNYLNLALTGLFTANGDSKTPMIASFAGLILNMILDPLLIIGPGFFPRMEAVGAAVATVISQLVVSVILILKMRSKNLKAGSFADQNYLKPAEKETYEMIFKIGFPASVQATMYCFFSMVLTRFVSAFGAEAVAVARVGGQIESVSWNTGDGFSAAINSFCGQNYGGKKYDRIRKGYRFTLSTAFLWGVLVFICFVAFPGPISRVFFHEEQVVELLITYLIIVGFSEPFLLMEGVTSGAISGLGKTKLCSVISTVFTGLRIPIAYILMHTALGLNGIWWTFTITSFIKAIIFVITFSRIKLEE